VHAYGLVGGVVRQREMMMPMTVVGREIRRGKLAWVLQYALVKVGCLKKNVLGMVAWRIETLVGGQDFEYK
jgi:hypothetical protein